ncbi:Autotransporter beta-domain containing protein [Methylophilaceae bacterium]
MTLQNKIAICILLISFSSLAMATNYEINTAETSPFTLNNADSLNITSDGSITLTGDNSVALGDPSFSFSLTHIGNITNAGLIDISGGSLLYGLKIHGFFGYTSVDSFTNAGNIFITSTGSSYGISIDNGDHLGPISNTGTIRVIGSSPSWPSGNNVYGIDTKDGLVSSINNSGTITVQSSGDIAYGIAVGSTDFIINSGNMTVSTAGSNAYGIASRNSYSDTINNVTNSSIISVNSGSDNATGIDLHYLTINEKLINSGTINVSTIGYNAEGIYVGDVGTLENLNAITVLSGSNNAKGIHIDSYSTVHTLSNVGAINVQTSGNNSTGVGVESSSTIQEFNNSGSIEAIAGGSGAYGVDLSSSASIADFQNSGTITASGSNACALCLNSFASVTDINNSGSLIANGTNAYGINSTVGSINSITNTGVIYGDSFGINSTAGTITTLNNLQGGDGSSSSKTPLTYSGTLPLNYKIIISSQTHYGQLSATNITGSTNFGIHNTSTITSKLYTGVLQGLSTSDVGATRSGTTYNGLNWTLALQNGSLTMWDLIFSGATAADTQASLHSLASKLRGIFSSQTVATNFANMNTYDCNLFDSKGLCVSVGGQQTYVDSPSSNMTSAIVVAGYKVSPSLRIGGFLNQNVNSNTGSNVDISNKSPLMGLFAVWNQNEDHLGYQVKIANAYQDKDVTTTRDVIGTSEAGRGKTDLNTQSYVGELSYAFLTNEDKTLVRPYAAVRYTRIKQDGYTERTTTAVTAPLTYAALSDRSTAALVGVKLNHKLTDKVNLTGSLSVEQDLNHDVDNLTASGVSGLTSEAFNNNINRTRPVASVGAYYMPVKNQRIAADLYYQQLPFQSTGSATAYVNYTIGF